MTKRSVAAIAVLCLICSSVFAGVIIHFGKGVNVEAGRFFDVSIDPSNVSLVVGQVQSFTVHSSLPSESLNYSWSYYTPVNVSVSVDGVQAWWNGSGTFDAGGSFSFSFLTACAGLRLSVHVVENDPSSSLYGGCGDASASVFDPYAAPSVYLDAFPIGTIVETDGAGWYRFTINGQSSWSSTNASQVLNYAIGNASVGSSVLIKNGNYTLTNTVNLNKDVSLIGEGLSTTPAVFPSDPDDMITGMTGVVISVTTTNTNAITINGTRANIRIENIGIHFTGSGTGHGVYSPAANDLSGLMFSTIENVVVWGHDADHYAFYLVNIQHCEFDLLSSFGGPAFHIETISTSLTYGISHFGLVFARVPASLTMHHNVYELIGTASGRIGGLKFDRLHTMDTATTTGASSLYISYGLVIDIRELDIENPFIPMVTLDHCDYVYVYNGMMFGGGITHTDCSHCGYWGGYISAAWLTTHYNVTTSSGTDFICPQVELIGYDEMNFTRLPQPASFIISRMGDTYYATDGTSGACFSYGVNLVNTLDNVLLSLPPNGGSIFFKSNQYILWGTWKINRSYVKIRGEGMGGSGSSTNGTQLTISDGANSPVLNITGNQVTLEDIAIDGNGAHQSLTTDAVVINGSNHCFFNRVSFMYGARYCVNLTGGGDWNNFRDCEIGYANKYGAYVSGVTYCGFYNCHVRSIGSTVNYTDVAGIAFDGGCYGCVVSNSHFNLIWSEVSGVWYGYGIEELSSSLKSMQYLGCSGVGIARGLFSPIISLNAVVTDWTYYYTSGIGANEPASYSDVDVAGFSYLVFTDGSTYYMRNGSTGRIDYSSTNASQVINFALGNETDGGTTVLGWGNFSLSAPILVSGHDTINRQIQWVIRGQGMNNTVICPQAGVDAFQLENQAGIVLSDLSIVLPTASSGYGINGLDVGYAPIAPLSVFERVTISGGSKWLIYINNPQYITFRDLYLRPYGTGGICFNQTSSSANFGNCIFDGHIVIDISANNGIGILFTRSGSRILNMMNSYGYLEISSSYTGWTNTTGIYASYLTYSVMNGIESESVHRPIFVDSVYDCFFSGGGYSGINSVHECFLNLTSNAYSNTFKDFVLLSSVNMTAFSGGTTDPRYANTFEDWKLTGSSCNINNSVTRGSIVRNIEKSDISSGTYVAFSGSPVGVISSPTLWGQYLLDFSGDGTIANNTLYTVCGSPKTVYVYGGTLVNCTVSGTVIYTTTPVPIHVTRGQTLLFDWSSSPTIVVVGEDS